MRKTFMLLVLIPALLCACAGPRLPAVRADEALAVSVRTRASPDIFRVRSTAFLDNARTGSRVGFWSGAVVGLGCGPVFWWVCSALYSQVGTVVGGAAGAGVGVVESISSEKLDRLVERVKSYQLSHEPAERFKRHLLDRTKKHWPIASESAGVTVLIEVEVENLFVDTSRAEQTALMMSVLVSVNAAGVAPNQKRFKYAGPPGSYAAWIDAQNDFIDQSLNNAFQHLSAQIVSELAAQ